MKLPVPIFNYSIKNATEEAVDIYIDGDIVDASTQQLYKSFFGDDTTTSFKSFRDQLDTVEAKVYNVYINSGGGIVTDAMAIHDLLKDVQSRGKTVNTIGRGIIASAATYILMAGNNSRMSKNSWFMIHNVGGGVYGDVNTVENYAQTLRKFNNRSRDFYADVTGIRKEDITKMMDNETWMTADEAKQKGFIKVVDGEAEFTNLITSDKWQFTNTAVLNAYNSAVKPVPAAVNNDTLIKQNFEDMKNFFQELGSSIMNAIKGVKAPENNDHGTLMTSIGEAVQKSFTASAEQMETAINEMVAEGVKNAFDLTKDGPLKTAFDTAVSNAVDAATKDLGTKITDLETAKGELEKDITNLKSGKQTTKEKGTEEAVKMKGSFETAE